MRIEYTSFVTTPSAPWRSRQSNTTDLGGKAAEVFQAGSRPRALRRGHGNWRVVKGFDYGHPRKPDPIFASPHWQITADGRTLPWA